jgi:hypothetical protein
MKEYTIILVYKSGEVLTIQSNTEPFESTLMHTLYISGYHETINMNHIREYNVHKNIK